MILQEHCRTLVITKQQLLLQLQEGGHTNRTPESSGLYGASPGRGGKSHFYLYYNVLETQGNKKS